MLIIYKNISALINTLCYNVSENLVIKMKLNHYIDEKLDISVSNINVELDKNIKKYQFFLDNISNCIYITDRLNLIRENDEYILSIFLGQSNECNIHLKKEKADFKINVIKGSYEEKNNYIKVEYILETDEKKHTIILETGE